MLVIGPYKNRVGKVISAVIQRIREENDTRFLNCHLRCDNNEGNTFIFLQTTSATGEDSIQINLEILPCVATFDQYYSSKTGGNVTYLKSLNYFNYNHGGQDEEEENSYSSLAPYFDNSREENNNWGIVAAIAGCGIQKDEHLNMIQQFLNTMAFVDEDANTQKKIIDLSVTAMQVQHGHKVLNNESTTRQPIGPQRMAQFVIEEAKKKFDVIMEDVLRHDKLQHAKNTFPTHEQSCTGNDVDVEKIEIAPKTTIAELEDEQNNVCRDGNDGQSNIMEEAEATITKYACKICRLLLFDQRDLQDPPHQRKRRDHQRYYDKFAENNNRPCESIFLTNPTPWMVQKLTNCDNGIQGKINCPKCSTKIGSWNWSGAQCSCGTWVTPAIQILASRVDTILPIIVDHQKEI